MKANIARMQDDETFGYYCISLQAESSQALQRGKRNVIRALKLYPEGFIWKPAVVRSTKGLQEIELFYKLLLTSEFAKRFTGLENEMATGSNLYMLWPETSLRAEAKDLGHKNVDGLTHDGLVKLLLQSNGAAVKPKPKGTKRMKLLPVKDQTQPARKSPTAKLIAGKVTSAPAETADIWEELEAELTPEESAPPIVKKSETKTLTKSNRGEKMTLSKPKGHEKAKASAGKAAPSKVQKKASAPAASAYPLTPDQIDKTFLRPDGRVNMRLVKTVLTNAGKWKAGMQHETIVARYKAALAAFQKGGKALLRPTS